MVTDGCTYQCDEEKKKKEVNWGLFYFQTNKFLKHQKKKSFNVSIVEMVTIKKKGYTDHLLIHCYATVSVTNQKHWKMWLSNKEEQLLETF